MGKLIHTFHDPVIALMAGIATLTGATMEYESTDAIRSRLRELRDGITKLATKEGDLDDQERADWAAWNEEIEVKVAVLSEREERARRLDSLRALNLDTPAPEAVGDGSGAGSEGRVLSATGDGARGAGVNADFHNMRTPDRNEMYDRSKLDTDNDRDGSAFRDRAMRVIDAWPTTITDGYRDSARALVASAELDQRDRVIADHIMKLSDPEYVRAFYKYLGNPLSLATDQEMQRAMSEGAGGGTAGGYMVPPFLDPAIILTNAGISNPFRGIATVKTITTQTWKGVTSAGVTAEWTAEAAEMTDASPTLGQPTITPVRADAYIQASFEMIEDTNIAGDLAMLFADARDRLEGTAFAVGTGSTQPWGVVTRIQATTASRVAANTNAAFNAIDVFNVDNNMSQRWRPGASWLANKSIYNMARQFATGTGALTGAFWVDFGGGRPSSLIGYPVHESSAMQGSLSTATASTDYVLVLGDFSQYYIVDRIGMSIVYNPLVLGANRRPTGEVGWAAFWRVGGDTVNADAFRSLVC